MWYIIVYMKTIFEKIIDREIPADIIYEDDICIVLLDIAPVHHGHSLVVSKYPYPWIDDVPSDQLAHMMQVSQNIIRSMKQGIGADYVQVGIVGTEVPHFHIHLIPRKLTEEVETSHTRKLEAYTDETEKQYFLEKLKSYL